MDKETSYFDELLRQANQHTEEVVRLLEIDYQDLYDYIGLLGSKEISKEERAVTMAMVASGDITVRDAVQLLKSPSP